MKLEHTVQMFLKLQSRPGNEHRDLSSQNIQNASLKGRERIFLHRISVAGIYYKADLPLQGYHLYIFSKFQNEFIILSQNVFAVTSHEDFDID